jgi:hypothetical protein
MKIVHQKGGKPQLLMVRVKADLNSEIERDTLYNWLDRWRHSITSCSRMGGVWEERFDVTVPETAVRELPTGLINSVATPLDS